ncbi:MAG: carbon starvation protein A [Myxococcales bacterium]|nr:carbon starvation protein A [Myxococcales bacterium]MCB9717828.1 carbon starvation protein A [Myxococcales bacterium]
MSPAIVALCAFAAYYVGYRIYSRFLARDVFRLDDSRPTPAHTLRDEIDYVPTRPSILFGHHFASITGLAPMLGPAVAVIWGWVPAVVWVVCGAIFVGCMHDFSALVLSVRNQGKSVGEVARDVISPSARTLFHLIIFFGVALAMGVFVYVIARLFSLELAPGHPGYPQAVLPSGLLVIVAMIGGWLLYRRGVRLLWVAIVGFALELLSIGLGMRLPTLGLPESAWPSPGTWTWLLLGYAFVASVLPVWALLQSRDFLNSLLLYLGVGLAYLGLFFGGHEFVAPPLRSSPEGAPSMIPFVFIVIACGAASGFHGLVSSGTTAKQLDKESDARPVGYGAMIGESLLGLLATLACTAGLSSSEHWHDVYRSWAGVQALPQKIDTFIQGTTTFLTSLGIPADLSAALIAMVVVSFALTTLDSATRLLRFNIEEIGATFRIPLSGNRYVASALACGVIAVFAFYEVDVVGPGGVISKRPAGLALWQLFGTTNQLLAALTLVMVTLYLRKRRWPTWPAALPALGMLASTLGAMVVNLGEFDDPLLRIMGGVLVLLGLGVLVESARALLRPRPSTPPPA